MSAKKPKIQKIEAPKTNNRIEQLRYLAALRGEVEQEAPKLNVKRFLIVSAIIVAILVGGIIFTSMKINEISAYNEEIYKQQIEAARAAAGMTTEEAAEAETEAGDGEEAAVVPEAPDEAPAAEAPVEEAAAAVEETVAAEAAEASETAETVAAAEAATKGTDHPEHPWNAAKLILLLLIAGLLVIGYILLISKPALRTKRNVIILAAALVLMVAGVIFTSSQANSLTKQTATAVAVETTADETAAEEASADGEAAASETAETAADSGTVAGIDNSISTWNLARVLLIALLVVYAIFMLVKLAHPKRRKPNRSFWGDLGIYILMAVFAIAMAFPLVFSIASSLKPLDELFRFPPRVFAQHVTLDNFSDLFVTMGQSYVPFSRYLANTVFITFIGTFGHVIIASMAAFVLAKYDFPGGRTFFSIVVTALMFSGYVTGIPNYVIMSRLGMIDTYWAIILPAFAAPIGLFLMKQFMEGLPTALIEAAHLDGAGEFRIFWSIVMPNVKPAWLTIIIFSVQSLWNTNAATVIYTEKQKTLVYALQQIQAGGIARTGQAAAVSVVVMFVPILVFIFSQNMILETMASSGLKD